MSSAITLATIFGTKVRMHLTFPILLLWVAAAEAITRGAAAAVFGVIFVMMLFVCVIAHEFGHVLGFRDGYIRGYRDLGETGFEILELTSAFDDIMSAPRQGNVHAVHFKLILDALE